MSLRQEPKPQEPKTTSFNRLRKRVAKMKTEAVLAWHFSSARIKLEPELPMVIVAKEKETKAKQGTDRDVLTEAARFGSATIRKAVELKGVVVCEDSKQEVRVRFIEEYVKKMEKHGRRRNEIDQTGRYWHNVENAIASVEMTDEVMRLLVKITLDSPHFGITEAARDRLDMDVRGRELLYLGFITKYVDRRTRDEQSGITRTPIEYGESEVIEAIVCIELSTREIKDLLLETLRLGSIGVKMAVGDRLVPK